MSLWSESHLDDIADVVTHIKIVTLHKYEAKVGQLHGFFRFTDLNSVLMARMIHQTSIQCPQSNHS